MPRLRKPYLGSYFQPECRLINLLVLLRRELARLQPPFIEENFEGLDVRRDRKGRTLVYVISDDNFFSLQKTILLLFALES